MVTPRKNRKGAGRPVTLGRKPSVDAEVLRALNNAFALGCTDEEACIMANISTATLYNYQKDKPDFVEEKELLKKKPFLSARFTIVHSLSEPEHAKWYAERKGKDEFGTKTRVDYTQTESLGTNADIIRNAILAMPPEERASLLSDIKPADPQAPQ